MIKKELLDYVKQTHHSLRNILSHCNLTYNPRDYSILYDERDDSRVSIFNKRKIEHPDLFKNYLKVAKLKLSMKILIQKNFCLR